MPKRLMDVNAKTTFDYLNTKVEGDGWEEDAIAVLNVDTPTDTANGGEVRLRLEIDDASTNSIPAHINTVPLTPEQARELAAALEQYAASADQEAT